MKRILSIVLICVLALASAGGFAGSAYADTTNNWMFTGEDCTDNQTAASTINYIIAKYPNGTQWGGSGLCFGYANKIGSILAKSQKKEYYDGLKFTKKNLLKKCKGVKAGTHFRVSNSPEYSASSGHSIVLLKVTSSKVYWTEANVRGYNNIRHYCASPETFINLYDFKYMNAAFKTKEYRTRTTPLLNGEKTGKGYYKLFWTKTTNTKEYKVYRATSKKGTYKLLKTVTKFNFVDGTMKKGQRYYYKVTAVKNDGSKKTSNIVYATRK